MEKLSEQTLAAIGRMTVAATDLELVLAGVTGEGPDGPLWVEASGTQLRQSRAALRAMWRGGRTDPALFDEITARLLRCRDAVAGPVSP